MSRKLLVVFAALTMVTVALPTATAEHLSVAYDGPIGTEPSEFPDDPDTWSVQGNTSAADGGEGTPYAVGAKSDCYDADPTVTAEEATAAALADGFCGQLLYNEGTSYVDESPPDQQIPSPFADEFDVFDVQRTYWTAQNLFVTPCLPFCPTISTPAEAGSAIGPVPEQIENTPGNVLFNATHDAASIVNVTDDGETANESDGDRSQTYGANVQHASPTMAANDDLGIWRMNGWAVPTISYGGGFVGYLLKDGEMVNQTQLKTIVGGYQTSGEIDPEANPTVCGFTPDRQFQSDFDSGFCDNNLQWIDQEVDQGDSYEDCEAPTYICSEYKGYWQNDAAGLAGAYGGRYQGEHMRWHFTVAPTEPECLNANPGFSLDPENGDFAVMAHDLDVYVPPHALEDAPQAASTDNLYSVDDGDDGYTQALVQNRPNVPLADQALEQGQAAYEDAAQPVRKGDVLEPNHVGAETYAIDDNSRLDNDGDAVSADRDLSEISGCQQLLDLDQEADPWRSVIDNGVDADRTISVRDPVVESNAGAAKGGAETGQFGLYGTDGSAHDGDNDATPDLYSTSGHVGIFTDMNDDGDYERVIGPNDGASFFGAGVYAGDNILQEGAYPMLWNMHLNTTEQDEPTTDEQGNLEIDRNAGCAGPGRNSFGQVMEDAGYGPNTGLAQAIYLAEPTAFYDLNGAETQVLEYPTGGNVFVFLNDATRTVWDHHIEDGPDDFPLGDEVDTLVEGLVNYVETEHDATIADGQDVNVTQNVNIHLPGDEFGDSSDFFDQCGTSTGGYSLSHSFPHPCAGGNCEGDTIATMYTFEVNTTDGDSTIGGADVPTFTVNGDAYNGFNEQNTWYDIDAFDGDASRNEQRVAPPPTAD